jgi:endonuclease/exonuclease/phosphatase family metal-dependent hydrolase
MTISWFRLAVCGFFPLLVFASACKGDRVNARPDIAVADTVRVLTFNILYGGDEIDFKQVIHTIRVSAASVVCIQEAEGQIPVIAAALGWPYYSTRQSVVSKFPILDTEEHNPLYVLIQLRPGAVFAVSNIHLPSDPYGPEAIRDGVGADSVLRLEQAVRYPAFEEHRQFLPSLIRTGMPVVVAGDFNTPSHLDWVPATVGQRPQMAYPFYWPMSVNMDALGFHDAYRTVHPDPRKKPGLTWTPGYPPPHFSKQETHDRIDFIYVAGQAAVLDCQLLGELGGPDVDIPVDPYASDHRAVVATIRLQAKAPTPYVAAGHRRSYSDAPVDIYYGTNSGHPHSVSIRDAGNYLKRQWAFPCAGAYGSVRLPQGLPPGCYALSLLDKHRQPVAENKVWVTDSLSKPGIKLTAPIFRVGEPIGVDYWGVWGNKNDWLAIYPAEADLDKDFDCYSSYVYLRGSLEGRVWFDRHAQGDFSGLTPGKYLLCLLKDDGYQIEAKQHFELYK